MMNSNDIDKIAKMINTYREDVPRYCRDLLMLKSKEAKLIPFNVNSSQYKLWHDIGSSIKRGEQVRKVLVKSRQIGFSTFTEAYAINKCHLNSEYNAFIIAEKQSSTQNVLEISKRFFDNLPSNIPKPKLLENSIKGMAWDNGSKIRLASAGGSSIGRSMTNQFLHASEVGFFDNADEVVAGLFQTVPNNKDSVIILESTGNGTSGNGRFFYDRAMEGIDKKSKWDTIFFPWFEHHEYQLPFLTKGEENLFRKTLSDEELHYMKCYNVSLQQLKWRRDKLYNDFNKRETLFRQEYPSTIQEAFQTSSNTLIPLEALERAKKDVGLRSNNAPLVIGVDPARSGDRTVICIRQGRVIQKFFRFDQMNEMK